MNHIVETARKYLGVPYAWGGTTPSGFDCSGFAQYVYAQNGMNISRTTYTQVKEGTAVDKNNLKEGDLVFFNQGASGPEHIGIYVGNNQYIHAPQTGDVVKISTFCSTDKYCAGRRIIY